jgi:predicted RNA binding protein YcfA (HicA-like mRNA interferase family)
VPSTIPSVPGAKVIKALENAGFAVARINGSHHIMRHPDGRSVAVPVHGSKDLLKGTLRGVLATVGMSADEFRALL